MVSARLTNLFYRPLILCFYALLMACPVFAASEKIKIGSRDFPESVLVAEILSSAIERNTEHEVDRKFHLGGVKVCLSAMESDNLDLYPDYTGSLIHNVLGEHDRNEYLLNYIKSALDDEYGFVISNSLGFENSFVLAVHRDFAEEHQLRTLSDLANLLRDDSDLVKKLTVAFKHSFMKRPDGYKMLQEVYGFDFKNLYAMEYNIAQQNLLTKKIDVIDSFSTDSRLQNPMMVALEDDRNALIPYSSVYVARKQLLTKFPGLRDILMNLESSLTNEKVLELNSKIEAGETYKQVADDFLDSLDYQAIAKRKAESSSQNELIKRLEQDLPLLLKALYQHINLSLLASLLATILGLVIGILISYHDKLARLVLGFIAVTQTIPSLALLALLIPVVGLGFYPALVALLIYALLPIIQNTYTGIKSIPSEYIELAQSLALTEFEVLMKIELPMSLSIIIAGIRTAVVICIGTATLATFVGGGGLGDLIKAGIDLNSNYMISLGAVPAALLALVASLILSKLERKFVVV